MKTHFTDKELGGCVVFVLTTGMFALSALANLVAQNLVVLFGLMALMYFVALVLVVPLGWMYIKHNSSNRMLLSAFLVAFGIVVVCMLFADLYRDGFIACFIMALLFALPASMFLHSSLVLCLRRTDYWLYLSQVFCVATFWCCGSWLGRITEGM